jgi:uncharacterized protein YndB with AHSA1/START domain
MPQHVHVDHEFSKPLDEVFAHLSEHENLSEVFGAKITRVKSGDDGHRNGVGSVRRLKIGPLPAFEETVTKFEPDSRIEYTITKGSPLKDHRGEMQFSSTPSGGSRLVYDIFFDGKLPGVGAVVQKMLSTNVPKGLARFDKA